MQRPERMRIWGDRDSSNDARSSDEEQEDDAPPSSQPRTESASEDEHEPGVKENRILGFEAGEVIEISSDEEEESESTPEEEAEAEDEQENGSEEAKDEDEQDTGSKAEERAQEEEDRYSEAELDVQDEFEGFDVSPDEKEFLNNLLDIAPPEAVMELTGKTRRALDPSLSSSAPEAKRTKPTEIFAEVETLSDIVPEAQRTKRVKIFAEDHPFREQKNWTEDDLQEYKDDVHEFAKAAGFSDLQADVEVGKAMGAWKIERGISLPSQLLMEEAPIDTKSEGGESNTLAKEAKRRRKAEKKARRRLARLERQSSRSTSFAISETKAQSSQIPLTLECPKLQTSQTYYVKQATTVSAPQKLISDDVLLSTADEKLVGLALAEKRRKKAEKKLRKKAKLGPKKSEYFPATLKDEPIPPRRNVDAPKGPESRRGEGGRLEGAKKLLAKTKDKGQGARPGRIKQMAQVAKQAVKEAPVLCKEASIEKNGQKHPSQITAEPDPVEKKKKNRNHKRHRNKNRLPEEQTGNNEASGRVIVRAEIEEVPLLPKKKTRDELRKSNLDGDVQKKRKTDLPSSHEVSGDPSNSQHALQQSIPHAGDASGPPLKRERRDRGRGRKPKSKTADLEMPDADDFPVMEPAAPPSNYRLRSIKTNDSSPKKKRKRGEDGIESAEVGETTAAEPLTELPETNSKNLLGKRIRHSEKRAMSADALEVDARPSTQASKVHHSQ